MKIHSTFPTSQNAVKERKTQLLVMLSMISPAHHPITTGHFGWRQAIGTKASMNSGYLPPMIRAFMPPIEKPEHYAAMLDAEALSDQPILSRDHVVVGVTGNFARKTNKANNGAHCPASTLFQ